MKYVPKEIRGKEVREILELGSKHNPRDSIDLKYYVRSSQGKNIKDVAKDIAKDETTGSWIGQGNPTQLFEASQADVERMEVYNDNEAVMTIRTPLSNMDLSGDIYYQLLMLAVGGPVLEFQYYEDVAWIDFKLPERLLTKFPGPKFGITGLRRLAGLGRKDPIIGTIVKPCCGLTADEVAEKCYQAALGGVSFIKDDEKMLGPNYCSFEERIRKVSAALEKAEKESGNKVIYAPHIAARADKLKEVSEKAIEYGATALMFNVIMGHNSEALQLLAEDREINVPLYAHSGGRAALSTGNRRIDDLVISKLIRFCGADFFQHGVFGAKAGGHIASLDPSLLEGHANVMRKEENGIKDTIPVTAGGLGVNNIGANLAAHYTPNLGYAVALLAGSNILKHPQGPTAGVIAIKQAVDSYYKEGITNPEALKKYAYERNLKELLAVM